MSKELRTFALQDIDWHIIQTSIEVFLSTQASHDMPLVAKRAAKIHRKISLMREAYSENHWED